MYLIHEFHNLNWITEINELVHDILIYWGASVCDVLAQNTQHIICYSLLKLPLLGYESKRSDFECYINANELLLLEKRAELQELSSHISITSLCK